MTKPAFLHSVSAVLLATALVLGSTVARAQDVRSPSPQPAAEVRGDLPVAALLLPFRADEPTEGKQADSALQLHVWLQIPGGALETQASPVRVDLQVFNRRGDVQGQTSERLELHAANRRLLGASKLRIHGRFRLEPGAYDLSLQLTDGQGRDLAVRRLPFEVPGGDRDQAALLPPFFIDDYGLDDQEDGLVLGLKRAAPFVTAGDEEFIPDLVPTIDPTSPRARVTLMGYHLLRDKSLLDVALLADDGTLMGKDRLGLVHSDSRDGLDRFDFSLQTEGLPAGEYQLEVSVQDLANGVVDQTLMPFAIGEDGP